MSRCEYSDECEVAELNLWRGAVASAIKGKRGQAMLLETLTALEAMPVKELIAHELVQDGAFCALGVVGTARGIDVSKLDQDDNYSIADTFGIAPALAAEIVFMNDEVLSEYEYVDVEICGPMRNRYPDYGCHKKNVRVSAPNVTARRWQHMRDWVASNINKGAKQ